MTTELFELTFIDGTKLWANVNDKHKVCFGWMGKGICTAIKEVMDSVEYRYLCAYAYQLSKKEFVSNYRDIINERSEEIAKQIIKAC